MYWLSLMNQKEAVENVWLITIVEEESLINPLVHTMKPLPPLLLLNLLLLKMVPPIMPKP